MSAPCMQASVFPCCACVQFESLAFFVDNMRRYVAGEALTNVCDKKSGY
jgi:hypothetical protein